MGFVTLVAASAAVVLTSGCDVGEEDDRATTRPGASEGGPPAVRSAPATTKTRCDIGGQPDYNVPGSTNARLAIIGCARLGLSMKPVEFSANDERFDGKDYVCLNPAFRDTSGLGAYIPNACEPEPISRRLVVVAAEVLTPRNAGVRGYQLVIWGTAAPSTRRVVAHYEGERTETAVFTVRGPLARAAGAARPFSVFVVELDPRVAPCSVLLRTTGASGASTAHLQSTRLSNIAEREPGRGISCAK
jgi:hypothetical protein